MTAVLAISLAASFTPVVASADNSIENILNEIQIKIQEIQIRIEDLHTQIQSQISNDESLDNFIAKPKENLTDVQTAVLDENQDGSQGVSASTTSSYIVFGGGGGGNGKSEEAPRPKAFIKVLTPNGGEELKGGETITIKWESEQVPRVYIKLRKGDDTYHGPEGAIVAFDGIKNEGFFEWKVPDTLPAGKDYSIRVVDKDAPKNDVYDDSDGIFYILPPSFITLSYPVGGETWTLGEKQTFQWEDSGDLVTYGIEIFGYVGDEQTISTWSISPELPRGTNSFEWVVGSTLACVGVNCPKDLPEGNYLIEVFGYRNVDVDNKPWRASDHTRVDIVKTTPLAPSIDTTSPSSGPGGTIVVLAGVNFTNDTDGNDITFWPAGGDGTVFQYVWDVMSPDGKALKFFIPTTLLKFSKEYPEGSAETAVSPGLYNISLSNTYGKSNIVEFNITE